MQPSPVPSSRTFSSPQKETPHPLPPPQPLATTNLLSVSMDLPVLNISHKWNHILCSLLCLASFTQRNIFRVHTCCSVYQCFIPLFGWIIFRCMNGSHFVYPSSAPGHLNCVEFLLCVGHSSKHIIPTPHYKVILCSPCQFHSWRSEGIPWGVER